MSMAYLQMLARTPGRREALLRELTDIFLAAQRDPRERPLTRPCRHLAGRIA